MEPDGERLEGWEVEPGGELVCPDEGVAFVLYELRVIIEDRCAADIAAVVYLCEVFEFR